MNKNLIYQQKHQNKVIKFSMKKFLITSNFTWVIKSNWVQHQTILVFKKQAKMVNMFTTTKKLNIKTNLA